MSQPTDPNCNVEQPGALDEELGEFWVGNPWEIFETKNLSSFERNRMYLNAGERKFIDVSYASGTDNDGDGRSSIAADLNDDGRLDLIVRQAGGTSLLLYENEFPAQNWLKVSLRGTQSNRLGIGARVEATIGDRRLVRELMAVDSFSSRAPLVVHLGLGDAERVDELTVYWPSGTEQSRQNVKANQHVIITEGPGDMLIATPGVVTPPK